MLADKLSAHIHSVRLYRERLAVLQSVWDNLSLLSQMNGDGANMQATRTAFEQLSVSLLQHLATESVRKTVQSMHGRAQVAIDVLVRNLFERTADIGFICADQEVQQYLLQAQPAHVEQQRQLRRRFAEYVAKYSVYEDVVLLAPDGTVLLQLSGEPLVARSTEPFIKTALNSSAAYVECFQHIDLFTHPQSSLASLIYAYRVTVGSKALGVLCLKFRLQDEAQGIFRKLLDAQDWLVLTFLDAGGVVLASSDPWQIPIGAQFAAAPDADGSVQRFAGREYLAVTHAAKPYQGYAGPGWRCHALIPIEQVCNTEAAAATFNLPPLALAAARRNPLVFAAQLQQIPGQAETIQRELNRAVWNGHIHVGSRTEINHAFSKALLWEISHTGRKTQEVFEQSVSELQRTVVATLLHSSRTAAALAVDILDRNLYERANDCRWWALDRRLVNFLSGVTTELSEVTQVLRQINQLYTVYHTLVLFDARCKVVAVSNENAASLVGEVLHESWVQPTLSLTNSQSYYVSPFEPSRFYEHQSTWVYSAALRSTAGRLVGGIGIVFDATPQLRAMLSDALMNTHPGSVALFVSRNGEVLAATGRYQPGDKLPLDRERDRDLLTPPAEGHMRIVPLAGTYYAIGVQAGAGYREYPGLQLLAMVMIPLGAIVESATRAAPAATRITARRSSADAEQLELATFHVGAHWLGVPVAAVLEATKAAQLHAMPEKMPGRPGYVMYAGQAVLVVDLAVLLDGAPPTTQGEIVLVRAADGKVLGLLVESLGEIPQVNLTSILPMADKRALTDRMVRGEPDAPLLLILNIERVIAAMKSTSLA